MVSAKTASARLESELKQERGNLQDLRKMLADERNVMSTMDMEHQQQLVELEQRHQEKVLVGFIPILPISNFENISFYKYMCGVFFFAFFWNRSSTCLTSCRAKLSQRRQSRKMKGVHRTQSFCSALKFRFVSSCPISISLWISSH